MTLPPDLTPQKEELIPLSSVMTSDIIISPPDCLTHTVAYVG